MWPSIRRILCLLFNSTRFGKAAQSLDKELEFHLHMEIEENIEKGMSREEARRRALIALGGIEQTREAYHATASLQWFSAIVRDARFGSRMFFKKPVMSVAVILTLTLCIGANSAIFSMLYALIINPLPYREPSRIVEISNSWPKQKLDRWPSSVAQYLDFTLHTSAFASLGLWQPLECTLEEEERAVRSNGAEATAGMFEVFDVKPVLGQFFTLENSAPANNRVLIITQSFWESRFQNNFGIIGQSMLVDGAPYQIIGVAPRALEAFDARVRFVVPLSWPPEREKAALRYSMMPRLYGRLKPAASIGVAYSQVSAIERRFYENTDPGTRAMLDQSGHRVDIDTVQSQRTAPVRSRFYFLEGGVLFVLLIGCGNIANLLLAHSNARQPELAIRLALGAERTAIARQLLIECLILTFWGAALGLAFTWGALKIVNNFAAQLLPNNLPFAIDGRILGFTAFLAVLTALFIGLFPVLHVLGGNQLPVLSSQSRTASKDRSMRTMSGTLIVAQLSVTLMLLAGAGLLIRSFANVLKVDPGFNPHQLITSRVALPPDYRSGDRLRNFPQTLLNKLREIPGLKSISLATDTPYQARTYWPNPVAIRDYKARVGEPPSATYYLGASISYLDALQIPLIEGRWFDATDMKDERNRFIVDWDFARRYFPGGSAVGRQIAIGGPPEKSDGWGEIIGVVGNVHYRGVEEETGMPFVYYPLKTVKMDGISMFFRGNRPAGDVLAQVRQKIRALDPGLAVFREGSMESFTSPSFDERQAIMLLLCGFAGLALLLSAIGIYGVLSCDVSRRTREIGIRIAIGATSKEIMKLILRQGMWKAGAGMALGIIGALLLSNCIASLLYDVKPTDPVSYGAVSIVLLIVAWLASYLPAHRAIRINPITALRSE
jgi:putative ABC transport system permease protein